MLLAGAGDVIHQDVAKGHFNFRDALVTDVLDMFDERPDGVAVGDYQNVPTFL